MRNLSFVVLALLLSSCINTKLPKKFYYEKEEDMPKWYKKHYPMIKSHFKQEKNTLYLYFRGSCFRHNNVILGHNDTLEFFNEKYAHTAPKYTSKMRLFPKSQKGVTANYKDCKVKIKLNQEYFFTTVCVHKDTLRLGYYNYPMVDIVE